MNAPDSTFSHPHSDDASAAVGDEAWVRAMLVDELQDLTRLAKIGMEIAEAVGRRTKADLVSASLDGAGLGEAEPEAPLQAPADAKTKAKIEPSPAAALRAFDLVFGRITRAVRLTYARRALTIEALRQLNEDRRAAAATVQAEQRRRANLRRIVESIARERSACDTDNDTDHEAGLGVSEQGAGDREAGERETSEREAIEREVAEVCERLSDDDRFGDLQARPLSDDVAEVCRLLGLSPDWPRLAKTPWARREMAGPRVGEPLAALKAEADAQPKTLVRVELVEAPPPPPGPWSSQSSPEPSPEPARPPALESRPESHHAWSPPDPISPTPSPFPPEAVWLPGEGPPLRRRRY